MFFKNQSLGFTLVELSIVLVIIGLMVGGVFAGKSMIEAAKINKTIKQVDEFKTALNLFQNQYDALPGDIKEATNLWGASTTRDGNGNNEIGSMTDLVQTDAETTRAWQHLSLAELIPGTYSGIFSEGAKDNAPGSVIADGIYLILTPVYRYNGAEIYYPYSIKTSVSIWLYSPSLSGGVLSTKTAYTIDKKFDDGKANSGNISGIGDICTGVSYDVPGGADYQLNVTDSNACVLALTIIK